MVKFEDFNTSQLRQIIKDYNLHYSISNYSKLKKSELITEMKKHLIIENDLIKSIKDTFNNKLPYTTKQKRQYTKAYNTIMNSSIKDSIPEETLNFYKENKLPNKKLKGKGFSDNYALHAVLINKSIPFEEAFKEAQNIIKKKKFFHRQTKNQYRFRALPKQKFKSFKSKKINKDITLVFGELKPEFMHLKDTKLEGAGIFDWLKEKTGRVIQKTQDFFKPKLDDFNNTSKRTLEQYGNIPIEQLFIMRTPIMEILNDVINFISGGKFEELKKKYAFDKLFHLSLVAKLKGGKYIVIEKNEVVNISPEFKMSKDSETFDIPLNSELTINKLLLDARQKVGDKTFFDYDAFNQGQATNCQGFIKLLLENQGLYTDKAKEFLFQDLENIYKELPSYVPKVAKGVTTIGAFINKLLGKGKDNIIISQNDFIKEHKHLIELLRKFDIPELLKEANDQAKELKMETGINMVGKGFIKKQKKYY